MARHTHAHACRGGTTAAALGIAALTLTGCSFHASVSTGSATPIHSSSSTQASSDSTSPTDTDSSTDTDASTDSTSPSGTDSASPTDAARTVTGDELSALDDKAYAGRAPSGTHAHCPDLEARVGASVRCWSSLPDGRTMGTTATVTSVDPSKPDGVGVDFQNDQDYTPAPTS